MLNFKQRLVRYLIGVLIGLLLVYAFFGTRDWTGWTPENRVRELFVNSEIRITDKARCELKCCGRSIGHVVNAIATGDVLFSESETKGDPLFYVVQSSFDKEIKFTFQTKDSIATLVKVVKPGVTCPCD
jgi:hypothetical protein